MIHQLKNPKFYIVLCSDLVMFTVSLLLAYAVRFAFDIPPDELARCLEILPAVLVIKVVIFALAGVYRGMWRYTSIPDALRIGKASVLATLVIMTGLALIFQFKGYPRSVYFADGIFTAFFCAGVRIGIRLIATRHASLLDLFRGQVVRTRMMSTSVRCDWSWSARAMPRPR